MNIAHVLDTLVEIKQHVVKSVKNVEMIEQMVAKQDEILQVLKDMKEVIEAIYSENKRVS